MAYRRTELEDLSMNTADDPEDANDRLRKAHLLPMDEDNTHEDLGFPEYMPDMQRLSVTSPQNGAAGHGLQQPDVQCCLGPFSVDTQQPVPCWPMPQPLHSGGGAQFAIIVPAGVLVNAFYLDQWKLNGGDNCNIPNDAFKVLQSDQLAVCDRSSPRAPKRRRNSKGFPAQEKRFELLLLKRWITHDEWQTAFEDEGLDVEEGLWESLPKTQDELFKMENAKEEERNNYVCMKGTWEARKQKRRDGLRAVHDSSWCRRAKAYFLKIGAPIPPQPDPEDKSSSKREWERILSVYRNKLRSGDGEVQVRTARPECGEKACEAAWSKAWESINAKTLEKLKGGEEKNDAKQERLHSARVKRALDILDGKA